MATLREQLDYARQSRDEWKAKWADCAETVRELKSEVAALKAVVTSLTESRNEAFDALFEATRKRTKRQVKQAAARGESPCSA